MSFAMIRYYKKSNVCVCWLLFIIYYLIVGLLDKLLIELNSYKKCEWFNCYEIIAHVSKLLRNNKTNKKKQSSLPSQLSPFIQRLLFSSLVIHVTISKEPVVLLGKNSIQNCH